MPNVKQFSYGRSTSTCNIKQSLDASGMFDWNISDWVSCLEECVIRKWQDSVDEEVEPLVHIWWKVHNMIRFSIHLVNTCQFGYPSIQLSNWNVFCKSPVCWCLHLDTVRPTFWVRSAKLFPQKNDELFHQILIHWFMGWRTSSSPMKNAQTILRVMFWSLNNLGDTPFWYGYVLDMSPKQIVDQPNNL